MAARSGRTTKYGEPLSERVYVLFTPSQVEAVNRVADGDLSGWIREIALGERTHPNVYEAAPVPSDAIGVPLIGSYPAGDFASEAEGREAPMIVCSEHPSGPGYAYVKVDGDSLDHVLPRGSLALIRKQWVNSGDIAAVRIELNGESTVTLKRFRHNGQYTILEPDSSNKRHKPMVIADAMPADAPAGAILVTPECANFEGVYTGYSIGVPEEIAEKGKGGEKEK